MTRGPLGAEKKFAMCVIVLSHRSFSSWDTESCDSCCVSLGTIRMSCREVMWLVFDQAVQDKCLRSHHKQGVTLQLSRMTQPAFAARQSKAFAKCSWIDQNTSAWVTHTNLLHAGTR